MKNLIIDLVTKDISSNYFLDILNLRQIEEFIKGTSKNRVKLQIIL